MTMFPRYQKCGSVGWCTCGTSPFRGGIQHINNPSPLESTERDPYRTIPDIRNKLSPLTLLIDLIERGEFEYAQKGLEQAKKSINYLADREVYEE